MRRVFAWVVIGVIPVTFLAIFFAWPVSNMVSKGFITESGFSLSGFKELFSQSRIWRIVGLTLGQAALGTLFSFLLGLPGAYLLYCCKFRGRNIIRTFVAIPFVLPSIVVAVMFKSLLISTGPLGFLHLDESFIAIIIAMVFFNYSVFVRTIGSVWAGLDPNQANAARTLGASNLRVLFTITLPALGPAIASGLSLVFLFCASAYAIVMVLGGIHFGTIETEIWIQTTQFLDLKAASALSIVQLVVVTISLIIAERARSKTEQSLSLRSDTSSERTWKFSRDWPCTLITLLVILGLLGFPIIQLIWRSLRFAGNFSFANYRNLIFANEDILAAPAWVAIKNSLVTAVQATVFAMILGLLVTLIISRRPRSRLGRSALAWLDGLFMLPLGISAVTVGFGFLITLNHPPFDLRSSMILIPLAQAMVALPLVVRILLPLLRAIDPRQLEAAATLGSGPTQVLWRIEFPRLRRGLGLAIGFAFTTSLGEFGATSFLARPDKPTIPTMIFRLIGRPGEINYGMAMASASLLVLLTGTVVAIAEKVRPKEVSNW